MVGWLIEHPWKSYWNGWFRGTPTSGNLQIDTRSSRQTWRSLGWNVCFLLCGEWYVHLNTYSVEKNTCDIFKEDHATQCCMQTAKWQGSRHQTTNKDQRKQLGRAARTAPMVCIFLVRKYTCPLLWRRKQSRYHALLMIADCLVCRSSISFFGVELNPERSDVNHHVPLFAMAGGFLCTCVSPWLVHSLKRPTTSCMCEIRFPGDPWGFLGVTSGMSTTVWRARHKAWLGRWGVAIKTFWILWDFGSRSWPIPKILGISATQPACMCRALFDKGSFHISRRYSARKGSQRVQHFSWTQELSSLK